MYNVLIRFVTKLYGLAIVINVAVGFPRFQNVIPNGDKLPHPCKPNYIWHGVGHRADGGEGPLNDFGKDFLRHGKIWNKSLCKLDSDKDGRSNGEELGDPNCIWTRDTIPQRQNNITHPGVCDPWESEECKKQNTWVDCDIDELKCAAIHETGVMNITIRMPETPVPNRETNYMCTMFDLPSNGDFHMIASVPYIDNIYVMHHMLLFGCEDTDYVKQTKPNKPEPCLMGVKHCNDIISVWTVGYAGQCASKEFGFRIGVKGYKRVVLQAHWNNPELKDSYVDSSGLTLYYTNKLRPNDAAVMRIGSSYFELPPGRSKVEVVGTCSSQCSKAQLKGPIYITAAGNHMHYLGEKQKIELIRNGTKIQDITNEDNYNYDKPVTHSFKIPIEVQPGDELKTTCVFKTTSKLNYTYYGQGTNDEMCYGFLIIYPAKNVKRKFCTSWKSIPVCELKAPIVRGCQTAKLTNLSNPEFTEMRNAVKDNCFTNDTCLEKCKDKLTIINIHPCMNGDVGLYIKNRLNRLNDPSVTDFYHGIESCSKEFRTHVSKPPTSKSSRLLQLHIVFVFGFIVMFIR
ncbi:tyramine beta-hydroxylase-like isoform X2 [Mytilus trossulus]|uniref:tyramine beta-hydroxylase-like isoform X2 n=1 Tax=Mytilus trossulus TaxID=6551 RepID=UPI003006403D